MRTYLLSSVNGFRVSERNINETEGVATFLVPAVILSPRLIRSLRVLRVAIIRPSPELLGSVSHAPVRGIQPIIQILSRWGDVRREIPQGFSCQLLCMDRLPLLRRPSQPPEVLPEHHNPSQ